MYGKVFASMFEGSMVGAGPHVFAVFTYMLANASDGTAEVNARLLAVKLGCSLDDVQSAIAYLEAPDLNSRNPEEDGRRIVKVGAFTWRIVSWERYRSIKNQEERRAYNRDAQRAHRERKKAEEPPKPPAGGSGGRATLAERAQQAERTPGQPPTPRKDPLFQRLSFAQWFPSKQWLEWTKELGISDAAYDKIMAEARDKLMGSHDLEWWDLKLLEFFKVGARSGSPNAKSGGRVPVNEDAHLQAGWDKQRAAIARRMGAT